MLLRSLKYGFMIITGAVFALSLGCSGGDDGGSGGGASSIESLTPKTATRLTNTTEFLNLISSSLDLDWRSVNSVVTGNDFRNDYDNYKTALPQFGDSSFLTNSSRLFSSFAFLLCTQSLNTGLTNNVVYRFLNFNVAPSIATNMQSEGQVKAFLTNVAARFWGRAPTPEELSDLMNMYQEHVRIQNSDPTPLSGDARTREVAVYICTAAASSAQTLLRGGKTL